jgi:aconitase B
MVLLRVDIPLCISFLAGSGLVAIGSAPGVIPLDMPESVMVKFAV